MSHNDMVALVFVSMSLAYFAMVLGRAYMRRLGFKEREMELLASHTAEKAAQYAAHSERLEARVRVLERIATDKSAGLSAEIADLRDAKLN
jgi:hypothetical protein